MTTDLRELLENAATSPEREANVAGAWRKAHRRNSLNRMLKVSWPVMALIVVVVVALFSPIRLGGGGARSAGAVPGWNTYDDKADGLTISFPSSWAMATGNLTPNLLDPKELVALATYSLNSNPPSNVCPQFPTAAINAMGSGDAFISILGAGPAPTSQTNPFPARPAGGFNASTPVDLSRTDFLHCLSHPLNGSGQWMGFTQAGRDFYVLAVIGTDASATLRSHVYTILNSIQIAQS
jgi:hypothetical protein